MKKQIGVIVIIVLGIFSLGFFISPKTFFSETYSYPNVVEDRINNDVEQNDILETKENKLDIDKEEPKKEVKNKSKKNQETINTKEEDIKKDTNVVTKTDELEELEFQYEKYGTKFYKGYYYNLETNSDGGIEKTLQYTIPVVIDASLFDGTAKSMREEAVSLVNQNMDKYNEMLKYVNEYREEVGASPVELDLELSIIATIRAMEMAYTDNVSHTRPNGSKCFTIFKELELAQPTNAGENIAGGYNTVQLVSEGWKKSEGHYQNIINSKFTKVGFGEFQLKGTSYGTYWAQMFTN